MTDKNWTPIKDRYKDAMERLVKPYASMHLDRFPMLDKMTGGFRVHEFSILCGSTGTGKTTLCANLSLGMMQSQIRQVICSVETGSDDYLVRMMSALMGEDWNTGDSIPTERLKDFDAEHGHFFKSEYAGTVNLFENRFRISDLTNCLKGFCERGAKFAIIDNINFFLEVSSAQNSIIEMDRAIHELIIFVKTHPMHVIMVMHPRKTDNGIIKSELDIKGSSTAVQEAHNVFLFNRHVGDNILPDGTPAFDRVLKLAKMRRRGKYVGKSLALKTVDCVRYEEAGILSV